MWLNHMQDKGLCKTGAGFLQGDRRTRVGMGTSIHNFGQGINPLL